MSKILHEDVRRDLANIMNCHGIDNELGIPDYALAELIATYLETIQTAIAVHVPPRFTSTAIPEDGV